MKFGFSDPSKRYSVRLSEQSVRAIAGFSVLLNQDTFVSSVAFATPFFLYRLISHSVLDLGIRSAFFIRTGLPRKEVIQPHLPIRLPCYDFTPVIGLTFDGCSLR